MLLERFVRRVGDKEIRRFGRQAREPGDGVLRKELVWRRGHEDASFYDDA
jgi:hypothetical protein